MNVQTIVVRSRGFAIWRQHEAVHGRLTLEKVAEDTGLGLSTVRKFLAEPDSDVTGSPIYIACLLSKYFGATLEGLLSVSES